MDDRFELHNKLQEAITRANVGFKDFSNMHHIAYTTFYNFIRNPNIARDRTLTSVRLLCEFLNSAIAAGLLPIDRSERKNKSKIVIDLYNKWWNNGKTFIAKQNEQEE
jgi:hypothetical protein